MTRTCIIFFFLGTTIGFGQDLNQNYRAFDFWIGEWVVYKHNTDTILGSNTITSILDGKAIKETYHSTTSKYRGTSLNKYNPSINQWEQFWVDNSGLTLHMKGNIDNTKNIMILQNQIITNEGVLSNKITWQKNKNNTVRQTWYQSKDKGIHWTIIFDGDYKPDTKD